MSKQRIILLLNDWNVDFSDERALLSVEKFDVEKNNTILEEESGLLSTEQLHVEKNNTTLEEESDLLSVERFNMFAYYNIKKTIDINPQQPENKNVSLGLVGNFLGVEI